MLMIIIMKETAWIAHSEKDRLHHFISNLTLVLLKKEEFLITYLESSVAKIDFFLFWILFFLSNAFIFQMNNVIRIFFYELNKALFFFKWMNKKKSFFILSYIFNDSLYKLNFLIMNLSFLYFYYTTTLFNIFYYFFILNQSNK